MRVRVLPEGRLVHDELGVCYYAEEQPPCYYCGLPATTKDHVLPQMIREQLRDLGPQVLAELTAAFRVETVDACRECNSLLGAHYDRTLGIRKARLKDALRRRFRRLLAMPEWGLDELKTLQGALQQQVESYVVMRQVVRSRIEW